MHPLEMHPLVKLGLTANLALLNALLESEGSPESCRANTVAFLERHSEEWPSRTTGTSHRKRLSIIPRKNNRLLLILIAAPSIP
jgi:hypothetical protein